MRRCRRTDNGRDRRGDVGVEGMMELQRGRRRRASEGYISRWERWRSDGGSYRGRRGDGETGARRRRSADRSGRER